MAMFTQTVRNFLRAISAREASLHGSTVRWRLMLTESEKQSHRLLISNLSREQREQYESSGFFEVTGGHTGKRYRIRHRAQLNVEEFGDRGRPIRLLCFRPDGGVPIGDILLAQKCALELFESDAIRIAHRSPSWDDVLADLRLARIYGRRSHGTGCP
jgi:hypothetical protein